LTTTHSQASDEAQIRTLIDDRVEAVRTKDVDGAMSGIAPDIRSFDVVNPLQSFGSKASGERAQAWFSSFQGPIGYETRDLSITTGGDVAFSHSLNRYSGTQTGGVEIDMWVRATACYRKIEGTWVITHEHQSVPFDGQSGRASLDLKP
jgi:ketosteroid isomerase-like protein